MEPTTTKQIVTHVFTPNLNGQRRGDFALLNPDHENDDRVDMRVSDQDRQRFNRLPGGSSGETVIVVDQETGHIVRVGRAACAADCYCAAEIVEVIR